MNLQKCSHENLDDRCLLETWCTLELHKAVRHGYEILEVYEVYHFGKTSRIFEQFMNMFLKLKQEVSGFPSSCFAEDGSVCDEVVDEFFKAYLNHKDIELD